MKIHLLTISALLLLITLESKAQTTISVELSKNQARELKISNEGSRKRVRVGNSKCDSFFEKHKIHSFNRTYPSVLKFDHPLSERLSRVYTIASEDDAEGMLREIEDNGIFRNCYKNKKPISSTYYPNDYYIINHSSGRQPYEQLDIIRAPEAWDITKGSRDIKIAILDNRFFEDQEDMQQNVVFKEDELAGPFLQGYHGSLAASAAAADTDNGIGISAIGFNSGLMFYSYENSTTVFEDMLDASLRGARVINNSWLTGIHYNQDEQDIINIVTDHGTIMIASAGNNFTSVGPPDIPRYPASYDNVISVGASNLDDGLLKYSPGHPWFNDPWLNARFTLNEKVDLVAPGYDVTLAQASWNPPHPNTYFRYSGTSFSCPIVSGTVALMLDVNPNLRSHEVESILKQSADRGVFDTSLHPQNIPYVNNAGAGRLDAYEAVKIAQGYSSHNLDWTNINNVSKQDDDIIKTGGSTWWNGGAFSQNYVPEDEAGWVEVIPESTSGYRMFGLSEVDQGATWNSILYNFYLYGSSLRIYKSGSFVASVGNYKAGDVLRVEKTKPLYNFFTQKWTWLIIFKVNSKQVYALFEEESNRPFLSADNCIYTIGASLDNYRFSHESYFAPETGQPVTWVNKVGVSTGPGSITKTNQSNWWNSGASSLGKIRSDYNGQITIGAVNSTSQHRMIGLTSSDQGATWNTIKYNLYLSAYNGGEVKIYSYGTFIQNLGSFEVGDDFKIAREDGYIKFFKNDILMYGWEANMNEDLVADVCMYTPGSNFNNVRIHEGELATDIVIPQGAAPSGGSIFEVSQENDTISSKEEFITKFNNRNKYRNKYQVDPFVMEPILTDSTIVSNTEFPVSFYPNPVSDFLQLKNVSNRNLEVAILHASTGELVRRVKLKESSKSKTRKVQLFNLNPGIYIVRVYDGQKYYRDQLIKK